MHGKENDVRPSRGTLIPSEVTPVTRITADLTKDDMVDIGVAHFETEVNKRLSVTNNRIKSLEEEVNKNTEKLSGRVVSRLQRLHESNQSALETVLTRFGDNHRVHVEASCDPLHKRAAVTISIHTDTGNHRGAAYVVFSQQEELTATETAEANAIIAQRSEIGILRTEGEELKKALTQIPRVQRQVRAQLASAELQKTDDGREKLQALLGNLFNNMNLLPSK